MAKARSITLPDTAMVTLWCRANEARRDGAIIDDPIAIELLDAIDYDYSQFSLVARRDIALRAVAFDASAKSYLAAHPRATVVALGEGMQTSFWRLDAAGLGDRFRWVTVDLPPIIELRARLLPQSPRISACAQSVLDFSWMDRVDPDNGVFVSAEGLLPYLSPGEALGLLRECARRFPGGQMIFDLPSKLQAALARHWIWPALRGGWPRTPFSLSAREIADLPKTVPGVRAVRNIPPPRGQGAPLDQLLWPLVDRPPAARVRVAIDGPSSRCAPDSQQRMILSYRPTDQQREGWRTWRFADPSRQSRSPSRPLSSVSPRPLRSPAPPSW
ncbi:class I SAM-dependent methyltransferase [Mycolicibacterium aichiense]|uniref:class I SAM-dependent methyltransferase n=1 Tax=Mycolicibacterium aichiense TaxID=1799 RepID=UPI003D677BA3